ncbi:MAG: hypothetical protein IKZ41_11710 [Clostridia bacterium]|nr:hypothetical protein [Clostridia bacterium]
MPVPRKPSGPRDPDRFALRLDDLEPDAAFKLRGIEIFQHVRVDRIEEGIILQKEGSGQTMPLHQRDLLPNGLDKIDRTAGLDIADEIDDVDDLTFLHENHRLRCARRGWDPGKGRDPGARGLVLYDVKMQFRCL